MTNKLDQSQSEQSSPGALICNRIETTCPELLAYVREHYEGIARDARYQHFVRIAPRIIRCLDYFGIKFDRRLVCERLSAYYLFIAVVDEALDFGNLNIGNRILQHFNSSSGRFDERGHASTVELVTEILRSHTSDENLRLISMGLAELYREVLSEQAATSIKTYIEHRKTIGARTADVSYLLIQDLLGGDTGSLRQLMKQVGKVGCLIDSMIDLNIDWRFGLLSFKPSTMDRIKLTACALREGARTLLQYPSLTGLFLAAIADDIRDPFRNGRNTSALITAETKDEVAGAI